MMHASCLKPPKGFCCAEDKHASSIQCVKKAHNRKCETGCVTHTCNPDIEAIVISNRQNQPSFTSPASWLWVFNMFCYV